MDIISIDNVTEDDGLSLLISTLAAINAEPEGPTRRLLVAVIPEYEKPLDVTGVGRMLRLDVLTVTSADPGALESDDAELMEGALLVAQKIAAKRAARPAPVAPKPIG